MAAAVDHLTSMQASNHGALTVDDFRDILGFLFAGVRKSLTPEEAEVRYQCLNDLPADRLRSQ